MKTALEMNDSCPHCGAPVFNLPTGPVYTCPCMRQNVPTQALNALPSKNFSDNSLKMQLDVAIETLSDLVAETCTVTANEQNHLDSNVRTAKTNAIKLLAKHGKVTITGEAGRRVLAVWK